MNVELQATCAALGHTQKGVYYKDPDCIETAKDLIRFLRRDDESCVVRLQLGEAQIVQRDLIPIVKHYKDDKQLFDTVLRLLVNLTQPAALCFLGHIPEDKERRKTYLELETHLQLYKEAFADDTLLGVLTQKLTHLLGLDWVDRHEEDQLLIERILLLLRNVLHVSSNQELRTEDDVSVHDHLLWSMHSSGLVDLLLYLGSSQDQKQLAFHTLEIISLMFKEQTPEQLVAAGHSRPMAIRQQDEKELVAARECETYDKKRQLLKISTRHSRFGGTYVLPTVKSISDRALIYHRPLNQVKDINFDIHKVPKKQPRNRMPLMEDDKSRKSTLSMRLLLREFSVQFLESCYNLLMRNVKDILVRAKAQQNDETYYLWAARFFMAFNRLLFCKEMRVDLVSETVSLDAFHYIQMQLQTYHEMILSNKKEAVVWSRRMHSALKAYSELLNTLYAMDESKDETLKDSSSIIKGNVFYTMEYRDIFLILIKKFDQTKQSRSFLRDLVEATHLFLKMLEIYCKKNTHIVVQKKKKKMKQRKKKNKHATGPTTADLDDIWEIVGTTLSDSLLGQGEIPVAECMPFDLTADLTEQQQKAQAIEKIQKMLRNKEAQGAVGLLRAARSIWPDGSEFGDENIAPEEEFVALREIFYADLPGTNVEDNNNEDTESIYGDEDDEMEGEIVYESREQEFSFGEFEKRFAQPQVVSTYAILLANFTHNSSTTNHCIVKMLYRIAVSCAVPALLYQARLFRIFQKVLSNPQYHVGLYKELNKFSVFILRKFFANASNNPKLFMELFFLKSVKEAVEVETGYGTTSGTARKQLWSDEQDDELKRLHEEFKNTPGEQGQDVVDMIMEHMLDKSKSRRQVLKHLKWLEVVDTAQFRKKKGSHRRGWTPEDENQLKDLFEKHEDSTDPVNNIIQEMTNPRSRQILLNKLLELGLITDKKQLRKKSKSKKKDPWSARDDEQSIVDDWSDEEPTGAGLENKQPQTTGGLPRSDVSSDESSDETNSDSSSDDGELTDIFSQISHWVSKVQDRHDDGIKWLIGCLRRMADDQEEDDDDENVPLVPLMEAQENAMEDGDFKSLLRKCGIVPPANEQESFWRIPGRLSASDLRARANILEKPTLHSMENGVQRLAREKREENKKNARLERARLRQMNKTARISQTSPKVSNEDVAAAKVISEIIQAEHSEDSKPESEEEMPTTTSRIKRHRADNLSDSDDDRLVIDEDAREPAEKRQKQDLTTKTRRTAAILDSDSDDDWERPVQAPESFPAMELTVPIDSDDSDIDDHIPIRAAVRRRVVLSDSE